jgi:hypothetical protein
LTTTQLIGVVAAIGLGVIAAFQVGLALGAPWGRAAWSGAHVRLPDRLRISSAVAAVIWTVAALVVLGRAGYLVLPLPDIVYGVGIWVLAALLTIGALVNFASSSPWERFGWGPFALGLGILCLLAALA